MRTAPSSTYRLQLHHEFTFTDAARQVPYLADLGVSHLYLSPILQAVPGSMHGYDVIDHTRINSELGGEDGFRDLVRVAREHDLGIIVDVVPNHMALVEPESSNAPVWQVLKHGRDADTAHWFDVDWKALGGRIGLPILGAPLAEVLANGEITLDRAGAEPVLRYYDHVFPIATGTGGDQSAPDGPETIGQILERQNYCLANWRDKGEVLNYRRFFEVDSLIAVRVELPDVFDATHEVLLRLHHEGLIDGFRIDHPDGLADPAGYLERLDGACRPGTPIWVEKILEGKERLPDDWHTAGTTGYDALRVVQAALTDPSAAPVLSSTWASTGGEPDFHAVVTAAKDQVVGVSLVPEVRRLTRRAQEALPDADVSRLREAVRELLVEGEVYRAYVRPGEPMSDAAKGYLTDAFARAVERRPDLRTELEALIPLTVLAEDTDAALDFGIRLQQTWGPVMAKSIEDTSYYRWHQLDALNEVGGDPTVVADASPDLMHEWAQYQVAHHPGTMTALSTHDTKRSEDTRARLLALAGDAAGWLELSEIAAAQAAEAGLDAPTAHLVWQTLAGVGEISDERLGDYLTKAVREAKEHTAWVDGDAEYEQRVVDFAVAANADGPLRAALHQIIERNSDAIEATVLAAKLLQLTLPGMPDGYQGCETVSLSLVDPDNRRPVDYAHLRQLLDRSGGGISAAADLDERKIGMVSATLQLRQSRPDAFGSDGAYTPWETGHDHVVGFFRGAQPGPLGTVLRRDAGHDIAVAVTRAPVRLQAAGGWGADELPLHQGTWRNVLTGQVIHSEGSVRCAELFALVSVALLERDED